MEEQQLISGWALDTSRPQALQIPRIACSEYHLPKPHGAIRRPRATSRAACNAIRRAGRALDSLTSKGALLRQGGTHAGSLLQCCRDV